MDLMDFGIKGNKVFYGTGEFQWVGFYNPIVILTQKDSHSFIVETTEGNYLLVFDTDNTPLRVSDISGKPVRELQREHHPHLYNPDGTWKLYEDHSS